jgi:hypothetical protein
MIAVALSKPSSKVAFFKIFSVFEEIAGGSKNLKN